MPLSTMLPGHSSGPGYIVPKYVSVSRSPKFVITYEHENLVPFSLHSVRGCLGLADHFFTTKALND